MAKACVLHYAKLFNCTLLPCTIRIKPRKVILLYSNEWVVKLTFEEHFKFMKTVLSYSNRQTNRAKTPPALQAAKLMSFLIFLCVAVLSWPITESLAASPTKSTLDNQNLNNKKSKSNQRQVTKVTYQRSTSEESPAARERRLKRECKGRPNAGACLGYSHQK